MIAATTLDEYKEYIQDDEEIHSAEDSAEYRDGLLGVTAAIAADQQAKKVDVHAA